VPRQDLTGADRTWAERYEVGDVLLLARIGGDRHRERRVRTGEEIDAPNNRLRPAGNSNQRLEHTFFRKIIGSNHQF